MITLLQLSGLCAFLALFGWAITFLERRYRDQQWREYLHGDGGVIAPDGRDLHGNRAKK
jgi:hypothetical protein